MLDKYYIDINNKKLNLEELDIDDLNKLNFQEETFFAKKIKEFPPFSKKRNEYSKEAYQKIFQIADFKKLKSEDERNKKGNGVTDATIDLLFKLIYKKLKKQKNIIFYEAGVGTGYAIERLKDIKNMEIKGCDVFLSSKAKNISEINNNIKLDEEDLYHNLQKIADNSIDIFYADNVMEHILDDEYDQTFQTIVDKVKFGGLIYFVIPNAFIGPSDVSKHFLKEGEKALGFHFMERTYNENMQNFLKYDVKIKYLVFQIHGEKRILRANKLFDFIKLKMEKNLLKIKDKRKRHRYFKNLGYEIYLFQKISK